MNRGFTTYYAKGLKAAAKTLYKNKNLLLYYAYLIMNLLARLTLFPAVLFDLAAVRQAKHVYEDNQLGLCASFRAAEKGKSLGTMLLVRVVQFLMLVACVAIALAVGGAIGFCGALIAQKANADYDTIQLLLLIPPLVFGLLTAVVLILFFAPSSYTVEKNDGFGMAGVLETSFDTMKKRGKCTHFLHHFVSLLVQGALIGGIYGLTRLTENKSVNMTILLFVLAAVLGILYLVFAPLFTLSSRVADYLLMEDVSLDPSNRAKHAKSVCISRSSGNARDYGHDRKLLELFDADGNDADYYAYDSAARRQSTREASDAFDSFVSAEKTSTEATEAPVMPDAPKEAQEPQAPETPPADEGGSRDGADAEQAASAASAPPKKKTAATATKAKRATAESKSGPTTTQDTGDDL